MNNHQHSTKVALISIGAAFLITAAAVYLAPRVLVAPTIPGGTDTVMGACYVGGCSSQICSDEPGAMSNCMYQPQFACYKSTGAKCERQATGKCGWTETAALTMCIKDADAQTSAGIDVNLPQ